MSTLDGGTYEVIRSRLNKQKDDLSQRLDQLNQARKEVFGNTEIRLIANNRIITENNCIPHDIVSVGSRCIFGYNVHFGLRTEISVDDVFSVYEFDQGEFKPGDLAFITDETFLSDFLNLYKYYRDTEFRKFFVSGNYLYMVFQVSDRLSDIKTFKWLIKDEELVYQDNRSDHEYRFPKQHDFQWQEATREMHRSGKHQHVSILDKVFVETLGGTLTIKIEDNTTTGKGIYDEEVIHLDQTLDDAQYLYADLGNLIALQIKPFQEDPRYFLYNHKLQEVRKIDSISSSAILLPEQQGLIFSNGYYLQTGEHKIFENSLTQLRFQERIASPNGEDFLYVFYQEDSGQYVLLTYNLISHQVATPIVCNGFTILTTGELCYFRAEAEHTKNHVVQIWATPFTRSLSIPDGHQDSLIYKIGNKEIVKAMAEGYSLIALLNKDDNYDGLYPDLTRLARNILDGYYWITNKETFELSAPLNGIREAAATAIDEFEKVVQLRQNAADRLAETQQKAEALFLNIKTAALDDIDSFVSNLSGLRTLRGEVVSLKDVRYSDTETIARIEAEIVSQTETVSQQCVQFLLDDKALLPYHNRVSEKQQALAGIQTVAQARQLEDQINLIATDLEMLIEIVSNLKIEDTSEATRIINAISLIFATLNRLKADLKTNVSALGGAEARADFAAQIKLIDQAIVNALDRADSPEKTDESLNKISVQLEDLEARFADFDEFTASIIEKREEIYNAFEARKNMLIEARNKKAIAIETASGRILKNVAQKAQGFASAEEINGYFASDLMISKLRDLVSQLLELEDSAKAEAIQTQLKSAQEDALRKLRDKQELFEDGENILRLGKHRFLVNKQPLDLTIVNREGRLQYHLTGTDFFQEMNTGEWHELQKFWNQDLVSENQHIYRAVYLAYKIFSKHDTVWLYQQTDAALQELVLAETSKNYTEGYVKGVHDADAFKILRVLLNKHLNLKLLRYTPQTRALAQFAWFGWTEAERNDLNEKIKSLGQIRSVFPQSQDPEYVLLALTQAVADFYSRSRFKLLETGEVETIARYLIEELSSDNAFSVSHRGLKLSEEFQKTLENKGVLATFRRNLEQAPEVEGKLHLAYQWVRSFLSQTDRTEDLTEDLEYTLEVTALQLFRHESAEKTSAIEPIEIIEGLAGEHPTIQDGRFVFHYHHLIKTLDNYLKNEAPAFERFRQQRHLMIQNRKSELRLEEFQPKVLTSFVRNKLIDKVYLPLFGDNLVKQIGSAGDDRRTDRSGMLLLVSPPGYGKTTLMEYLANRLGLIFMKINGPAIGHEITSVDPSSASNSASREELKKLNLALQMGNNVMLYLDDIQHCSPEFLQKFISLADGTRKIEGVFEGKPKTYDMKSKRFCVVMAGNPYTETGEKFRIPDMLANRADIYNLGDVIGNTSDLFELSLIENAIISNSGLSALGRHLEDLYPLIRMAESNQSDPGQLKGNHSKQEVDTFVSLLKKVIPVRDVVLKVNAQYIASAAMEDAYRTEPPFKLQGSYRDMNKLVSKIDAVMNDQEISELLNAHYQNETQTLTNAAEANLLKYKELTHSLNQTEAERWESIKETFVKNNKLKGFGNRTEMAQMLQQMMEFTGHLEGIKEILDRNAAEKKKK